jgi:hypothetical protein
VTAFGSTTLGLVVPLVVVPVVGAILVFLLTLWREGRDGVMSHLRKTFTLAAIVVICGEALVYGSIYGYWVMRTVYKDHGDLVTVTSERDQLAASKQQLQTENSDLVSKLENKPTTITKTITAPPAPVQKQCWLDNHFGMPNSTIKGAVTATAAIMHCNYKVDAPFKVTLEFDRDFIPGALTILGAGVVIDGGGAKQGNLFVGGADSPSLRPEQLLIVTVYGPTDQYPRATRGKIEAIQ